MQQETVCSVTAIRIVATAISFEGPSEPIGERVNNNKIVLYNFLQ
jgi:hypothetical protein